MKRIVATILSLVLALSMAACAAPAEEAASAEATAPAGDSISIGIIQLMEHEALDNAREGFVAALAENGYVDGENITLDIQNAQGDQSNLATISDRFVSNNVDLVLAIATPAAQTMAGKTTEIPILATAVTDFEVAKLVDSNEVPGGNVSGTNDMNPVKEQIDLLVKFVPEAKTVGCIYNGGEDNSVLQAGIAKEAIEAQGLAYTEVTVTSTNDVQQAIQTLVGKCDAVYIPTDNTVASAMPIVEGVTVDAKIPVIAGESGIVMAGGLATLGINYYNLGYQTGLMALRILVDGEDISTMPVESLEDLDYIVNGANAEAMGIAVPEDLQQYIQ